MCSIVTDPDPQCQYVFGPPGSGSGIICTDPDPSINKQKIEISHEFNCFVTSQKNTDPYQNFTDPDHWCVQYVGKGFTVVITCSTTSVVQYKKNSGKCSL